MATLTPIQRLMDRPAYAAVYEWLVHPLFLLLFTRRFRFESIYRELRRLREPASGPTERLVLDVACGTGWFGRRVLRDAGANLRVIGVDTSPSMLDQAGRRRDRLGIPRHRLSLLQADAQDMGPIADASVDELWLCGALHLIPRPERTLSEVARVLKPGAALLCQTFVASNSRVARRMYRRLSGRSGFEFFADA